MTEDRLPKAALNYKAIGRRAMGRPRMRWVPEQVYICLLYTSHVVMLPELHDNIHTSIPT